MIDEETGMLAKRELADIKSEPRPASNRNRWPTSDRNVWPASSESAHSDGQAPDLRRRWPSDTNVAAARWLG
jgi:hypothetical protein